MARPTSRAMFPPTPSSSRCSRWSSRTSGPSGSSRTAPRWASSTARRCSPRWWRPEQVAVPLREVQQVADAAVVTHAPASPWRRRAVWIAGTVAVLALGMILFSGGFPDSLVVDAAKPFNAFGDWVITHQRTNPLFVDFLVPLKNGINSIVDQLQLLLARMTWLGVTVTVAAIAGVLAGWRMAILAAAGFVALGLLGLWADSLITLTLVLVSV